MLNMRIVFGILVSAILVPAAIAEMLYVDGANGNDVNPGTEQKPLKTIGQAAAMVNSKTEGGPTTIKVAPGVYNLTEAVLFENTRPYTKEKRLIIEASILPDDPGWNPILMPVILPTAKPSGDKNGKGTYGLKIEMSHVTIRGLKFLGNPIPDNKHWPIRRDGKNLKDLVVAQCLFMGDRHVLPIQVAVIARGHGLVVDHCVFYNCKNALVLWDVEGGESRGCVMRYCIVDGAYTSGVWVTQTAEDFEFHHNIVTRCEYFWLRKAGDKQRYRVSDCIVSKNKYYSGYGTAAGPSGRTGPEVTYEEKNVTVEGEVVLEKNKKARNYLHVVEETLGSGLGAGLFREKQKEN